MIGIIGCAATIASTGARAQQYSFDLVLGNATFIGTFHYDPRTQTLSHVDVRGPDGLYTGATGAGGDYTLIDFGNSTNTPSSNVIRLSFSTAPPLGPHEPRSTRATHRPKATNSRPVLSIGDCPAGWRA